MRAPPLPLEAYPFASQHDLRYADLDPVGHVNNGAYGALMENCRVPFFSQPSLPFPPGTSIVILRIETDFLKEMHWPGTVTATCGIESVGRASYRFRQAIYMDGTCRAEAVLVGAVFDLTARRTVPITDALRAAFMAQAMRG